MIRYSIFFIVGTIFALYKFKKYDRHYDYDTWDIKPINEYVSILNVQFFDSIKVKIKCIL